MNDAVVLDTSALIALMHAEPGYAAVAAVLPGAHVSAVNIAEVVSKLAERGMPSDEAYAAALALGPRVVPFDGDLAAIAGWLRPLTRTMGLSLGDRCCLALAKQRNAVAYTMDRAWAAIPAETGIVVRVLRGTDH